MKHLLILIPLCCNVACSDAEGLRGEQGPQGPPGEIGATGPQGPQGSAGATGGGLYTSRQDVYCKQLLGARADAGFVLEVECNDPADPPLIGSCDGVTDPNAMLSTNRPGGWGDTTSSLAKSTWICTWTFPSQGVTPAELPGATANICCIKHR